MTIKKQKCMYLNIRFFVARTPYEDIIITKIKWLKICIYIYVLDKYNTLWFKCALDTTAEFKASNLRTLLIDLSFPPRRSKFAGILKTQLDKR